MSTTSTLTANPEVVDEEEGEIREEGGHRVRRCKHGRIRRDKPKDSSIGEKCGERHRSHSSEAKAKHVESGDTDNTIECPNSNDVPNSPNINVKLKEKRCELNDKNEECCDVFTLRYPYPCRLASWVLKSGSKTIKESQTATSSDRHHIHERRLKDQNRELTAPSQVAAPHQTPHQCRKHRAINEPIVTVDDTRGRSKRKGDDSTGDTCGARKRVKSSRTGADIEESLPRRSGNADQERHKSHKHHHWKPKTMRKLLSNTTKMRSYRDRDGKPKDPKHVELMFRERELSKKLNKKLVLKSGSKTIKDSQTATSSDRHHIHERRLKDQNRELTAPSQVAAPHQTPHQCRKHRAINEPIVTVDDTRGRSKRKGDDPTGDTCGARKRVKSSRTGADIEESLPRRSGNADQERHKSHKHHKSSRHKHTSDRKESHSANNSRHIHRSSKHTRHSSKSKASSAQNTGADTDSLMHLMAASGNATVGPTKILRDHSSYADITPLDSKEIYAEGDRIVINVNFKRDSNSNNSRHQVLDTKCEDNTNYANSGKQFSEEQSSQEGLSNRRSSSQSTAGTDSSMPSKRLSSKKDDSIYWASPPPTLSTLGRPNNANNPNSAALSSSGAQCSQSSSAAKLTTSITRVIDLDYKSQSRSSGADRKHSDKFDPKEGKMNEELPRFLPRSLHQSGERPIHTSSGDHSTRQSCGPHTPEGDYCGDQFMPTPTQDESLSPQMSGSTSRSSPLSGRSTPGLSNGGKDDVYDPEAPLQSPPQPTSPVMYKKSRPDPKSPSPEPQSLTPSRIDKTSSKRSPHRDLRRQSTVPLETRDYSPKDAQKSANHSSLHSPFKSPLLLPQRQQKKASAPVSVHVGHSASSSALMPPPQSPVGRSAAPTSALTAISKINPHNLAQLLKMAQTLSSPRVSSTTGGVASATTPSVKTLWDQIIKSTAHSQSNQSSLQKRLNALTGAQSSAIADPKKQMSGQTTANFIKKLNRQERVIEEVKLVLKPHYQKRSITKDEYKDILRKSVPKICHSRSGEINPRKIKSLVEGYIKRYKYLKKKSKILPKK
ncbi:unnamed protein product [Medioppia subpectinata]|uniref:SFR19-like C-terminal domain-containing protein n=1 Tax=Medioppia subpectinata TaxID=1979941 RepID=A0A7R9PZP2_9ACAR|nr:unnamed protein product [Medioppia subpectinata]CAG2107181.1 unnamed protein product [Medioppia subpectinata]